MSWPEASVMDDGVSIRQLSDAWYYITNCVEDNMVRSGWKKEWLRSTFCFRVAR